MTQSEIVLYTTADGQVKIDSFVVGSILEHTTLHGAISGKTQKKKVKKWDYFDEWLERIWDIRASEKRRRS